MYIRSVNRSVFSIEQWLINMHGHHRPSYHCHPRYYHFCHHNWFFFLEKHHYRIQFLQLSQLSGQAHTHTQTHTHTQWKARTWDTRTHIKTHIAYSLMWQARSRIVLSDSIPDGKAVPPVYLAPGHPWDSLSAFFPLPKTCSPVYHLIDSQRKAKIDSVTPTSLNSFLAKQTLHALTC